MSTAGLNCGICHVRMKESVGNTENSPAPATNFREPDPIPAEGEDRGGMFDALSVWVRSGIAIAVFASLTLSLQWLSGAYGSEFGAHPDEAAHVVTGLMVRDYLLHGIPRNPLHFAQEYYEHYPKVAFGHYPPVLYLFEAVWTLIFSSSRTSILLFMAAQSLLLATVLFSAVERQMGFVEGLVTGALCCLVPLVQESTSTVMADLMLTLFCLLAGLALVRYITSGRWADSCAFGLFASLAILTKGSALFLAAVPAVAILLCKRIDCLKRVSFWLPALMVALLCGPWMVLTARISGQGFTGDSVPVFFEKALPFYLHGGLQSLGFAIILLAALGVLTNRLFGARGDDALAPLAAVMTAIPLCSVAFSCVVPVGLEFRYLLPAVPPLIILAVLGIRAITSRLMLARSRWRPVLPALMAVAFLVERFEIPQKRFTGFRQVTQNLRNSPVAEAGEILISSDARGEGAFIAELAIAEPSPTRTVRRASKLLATSDWMARDYSLRFESAKQLSEFLTNSAITSIVVDHSVPQETRFPHQTFLEEALRDPGMNTFELIESHSLIRSARSPAGEVEIFQRRPLVP